MIYFRNPKISSLWSLVKLERLSFLGRSETINGPVFSNAVVLCYQKISPVSSRGLETEKSLLMEGGA